MPPPHGYAAHREIDGPWDVDRGTFRYDKANTPGRATRIIIGDIPAGHSTRRELACHGRHDEPIFKGKRTHANCIKEPGESPLIQRTRHIGRHHFLCQPTKMNQAGTQAGTRVPTTVNYPCKPISMSSLVTRPTQAM